MASILFLVILRNSRQLRRRQMYLLCYWSEELPNHAAPPHQLFSNLHPRSSKSPRESTWWLSSSQLCSSWWLKQTATDKPTTNSLAPRTNKTATRKRCKWMLLRKQDTSYGSSLVVLTIRRWILDWKGGEVVQAHKVVPFKTEACADDDAWMMQGWGLCLFSHREVVAPGSWIVCVWRGGGWRERDWEEPSAV